MKPEDHNLTSGFMEQAADAVSNDSNSSQWINDLNVTPEAVCVRLRLL